jgi:transcriptional regulator with XRE-family HTH domain
MSGKRKGSARRQQAYGDPRGEIRPLPKISERREQKRLKKTSLAQSLGVSRQELTNWEHSKVYAPNKQLARLAYVLDIPLTRLLGINANKFTTVRSGTKSYSGNWMFIQSPRRFPDCRVDPDDLSGNYRDPIQLGIDLCDLIRAGLKKEQQDGLCLNQDQVLDNLEATFRMMPINAARTIVKNAPISGTDIEPPYLHSFKDPET